MRPIGIKYVSYWNASGYANAARRAIRGLIKAGIPLTWTPLTAPWPRREPYSPFHGRRVGDAELDPYCNRAIDYDTVVVHTVPDHYEEFVAREPGKRIVGSTVWEMEQVPQKFLHQLAGVDLVIVPSDWSRAALLAAGLRVPVAVVPHTLDETPPPDRVVWPLWGIPADRFVFYSIGSWEPRKNMAALVRCYLDTFTGEDNVCLFLKTAMRDMTRFRYGRLWHYLLSNTRDSVPWQVHRLRRGRSRPAAIRLLPVEVGPAQIAAIHRRGDCFVSLTHSEGWGLGAFDAAAAGKPVIITGYGGQNEFLPAEDAWRVEYTVGDLQPAEYIHYTARWANPDLVQTGRLMRYAAEHRAEGRQRGSRLAASVHMRYNPVVVTDSLLRALA